MILSPSGVWADEVGVARRHFERAEYDQALVAIEGARREAGEDRGRLAEVWLLEGYVDVALGREEAAMGAFRRALRLVPSLRAAADLSPKLEAVLERARAEEVARGQRRAATRLVLMGPEPPSVAARAVEVDAELHDGFDGVTVRLEVRDAGNGLRATLPMLQRSKGHWRAHLPAEFARAAATLELRAEAVDDGEVIASGPATVEAPLRLVLPSHSAALRVVSPVDGAEVLVSGKGVGRTPLSAPIPVEPGRVTVVLRTRGGEVTQEVEVRPGEIALASLALTHTGPAPLAVTRYTLLAAGSALLLAGAILAAEASASARSLESAVAREAASGLPSTEYGTVAGFERAGHAFSSASVAGFVVGGVALATGLVLLAVRGRAGGASAAARPVAEVRF